MRARPGSPTQGRGPLGLDPRRWWLLGLPGTVIVAGIAIILLGGDDDGEPVTSIAATTTSTTIVTDTTVLIPATTTAPPATTAPQTTSTDPPAVTATPKVTVEPSRCTGNTSPDEPEPVATVLYEAWSLGDRECAELVATDTVVEDLFDISGEGASWDFQGCEPVEDPEPYLDCSFTYEGGAAHMTLVFGEIEGWLVTALGFVAD